MTGATGGTGGGLIAVDIGNTSTQIGLFLGERLERDWRLSSGSGRTADELRQVLRGFLGEAGIGDARGMRGVLCSVVPPLTRSFVDVLEQLTGAAPVVVDGGGDLGVENLYADPSAVGPDRLANALAAVEHHGTPAVVVDIGTAITFDVISARGEYLGGAIAPGVRMAADALFRRAARLPRVELEVPPHAIGRTTGTSIQSGVVLGAAILVDGLVARIAAELGERPRVIATGGDATLLGDAARTIDVVDPTLTLEGLRLIEARRRQPAD